MLVRRAQLVDFSENDVLLRRFGIDYKLLNKLANDKQRTLKKLLDDLQYLIDIVGEKESTYALMNWADVFFAEKELEAEEFFAANHRLANKAAKHANNTMTMVYLGFNALGFILSILALPGVHASIEALAEGPGATAVGSSWNYLDTCGGIILGITQILQGEMVLGMTNLVSSLQLAGCTLVVNLGKLAHLSAQAMCGLGFSFAAGMFISGALDFYEVYKADKRIEKLQAQQAQLHSTPDSSKFIALQKAIYIEKAQRANHLRSAASWMAGGVAMALTAVAGYIALSGVTFGVLPIATVIFAGTALLTALIRQWWVNRVDHVENVKLALKKPNGVEESLFDRLQKCIHTPEFNCEVIRPGISLFGDVKIKLKDYLEKMLLENPKKLNSILNSYERRHQVGDVLHALHQKNVAVESFDKTISRQHEFLSLRKLS